MFHCVNCGYDSTQFKFKVTGVSSGAFTYQAACPKCESRMVNVVPNPPSYDNINSMVMIEDILDHICSCSCSKEKKEI